MKYHAIIFDMDGTIIDSEKVWETVVDTVLKRRNIMVSTDMYIDLSNRMSGAGIVECCHILKNMFCITDSAEMLVEEKMLLASELYREHVEYMRGFIPFFEKIKTYGLKVAVATNATAQTVYTTNEKLKMDTYFGSNLYHIAQVNNRGKPYPDIYLHAAQSIDVNPRHCIAIEDSAHGINAAIAAGMFCIGLDSSRRPQQVKDSHLIVQEYDEIDLDTLLF